MQIFKQILDANPDDWLTRQVYADWLEENGQESLAKTQRWLVEHKLHPDQYLEYWFWGNKLKYWLIDSSSALPVEIFEKLRYSDISRAYVQYNTREEAELDLAQALAKLHI